MFKKLDRWVAHWASSQNPFTNVYGLARSLLALATLITLLFNHSSVFFRPSAGSSEFPNCSNNLFSIFCLVPNDYFYLEIVRWISILVLIIVISGWRPRYTGIIHWWITFSFWQSAATVDGGDQVAAVFTLLLIPITLCDPRKNHWIKWNDKSDKFLTRKIVSLITIMIIKVQAVIIYFHSTVAKLASEEWINGTAVWYYVQFPMLGTPLFLEGPIMWLLSTPFVVIPTWGTLIMQTVLVAALFSAKKYRAFIFLLAVLMHEVFALFLGLISFSIAMLGVLIFLLRPLDYEFKFLFLKKVLHSLNYTFQKFKGGKYNEVN